MSDLVGNPEDRFSHNEAQLITDFSPNNFVITQQVESIKPIMSIGKSFLLAVKDYQLYVKPTIIFLNRH